jgi:ubiquinone/menaquinone biosynthesis C-methylase UbiE
MKESEELSQKEVWNEVAKPWSEFRRKPIQEVIDFLKNKTGNILDLGCGSGRNIISIKDSCFYCVDFSENMIKLIEEKCKKEKIKCKGFVVDFSKEKLPFSNDFFDSILFIRALHCVKGKLKRKNILKEVHRVLKPNSQALIEVWSYNSTKFKQNKEEKFKQGLVPWSINKKEYPRYYYLYELNEFKKELEEVGFKIISIKDKDNISVIVEKN